MRDLERELNRLTVDPDKVVLHDREGLGRRLWALIRRDAPTASAAAQRA